MRFSLREPLNSRFPNASHPVFLLGSIMLCFYYGAIWLLELQSFPGGKVENLVMFFRSDHEYFPMISGAFRFWTDPRVFRQGNEYIGPLNFPILALLPNAVFFKLFGPVGFVVAEIAASLLRFLMIGMLFQSFCEKRENAFLVALFFETLVFWRIFGRANHAISWANSVTGSLGIASLTLTKFRQEVFHPDFYLRIPRPLWIFPFFLWSVGLSAKLWRGKIRNRVDYVALGLSLGVLANSNLHSCLVASILACFVLLLLLYKHDDSKEIILGSTLTMVAAFFSALPFLFQGLFLKNPSTALRWGQIVLPYGRVAFIEGFLASAFSFSFLLLLFQMVRVKKIAIPGVRWISESKFFSFSLLLLIASGVAMPVIPVLLGQAMHDGHFFGVQESVKTIIVLVLFAIAVERVLEFFRSRYSQIQKFVLPISICFCAMSSGMGVIRRNHSYSTHPRADIVGYDELKEGYRDDFLTLETELARVSNYDVLLSFDSMVVAHQGAFHGKSTYFHSGAPVLDSTLEERFLSAMKLFGVAPDRLAKILNPPPNLPYIQVFGLAYSKYSISRAYSIAPLNEYPPEILRDLNSCFSPFCQSVVPSSKLKELQQQMESMPPDNWKKFKLDRIVLLNNEFEKGFTPDPKWFSLAYQNRTFRLYLPKGEV